MVLIEPAAAGSAPGHVIFFGNRKARRGEGGAEVVRLLEGAGIAVTQPRHRKRSDVSDSIREHGAGAHGVVIAGGDGSLNASIGAVLQTGLPLGIVPMGTANDLARTLGIPTDPAEAVRVIAGGHRRKIDVGTANDRFFFNVASIGLAARIAHELSDDSKKRLGVLAYGAAAARAVTRSGPFWAQVETENGLEEIRTMQISVAAGRYFGGGLMVDEKAEPDDGTLHVLSLEREKWWELLPLMPALLTGRIRDRDGVRWFEAKSLTIRTRRKQDVDLDGDLLTKTPVRFGILSRAVEVFVPGQE